MHWNFVQNMAKSQCIAYIDSYLIFVTYTKGYQIKTLAASDSTLLLHVRTQIRLHSQIQIWHNNAPNDPYK